MIDTSGYVVVAEKMQVSVDDVGKYSAMLLDVWKMCAGTETFPCFSGCTDCCSNAAITCSRLEYEIIVNNYPNLELNSGFGCIFKSKKGCSVYNLRPLVCRMFGYYVPFDAPSVIFKENLMGQTLALSVGTPGFCNKKRLISPFNYDNFAAIMEKYKAIVDFSKIVSLGVFKDKQLNAGLGNIDKVWQEKNKTVFWIRG